MIPWRKQLGLGLGVYGGVWLSAYQLELLRGAAGWAAVQQNEPATAEWILRAVALPFHTHLSEDQIAFIVSTMKDASINVGAGSAIYL